MANFTADHRYSCYEIARIRNYKRNENFLASGFLCKTVVRIGKIYVEPKTEMHEIRK